MSATGRPVRSSAAFCRRCGAPRPPEAAVCPACGLDLDADGGPGLSGRARTRLAGSSAAALAKVAGLAWLLLAVASGVGFAIELASGGSAASRIGLSTGLELLTGIGLFLWPSWEMLTGATLWGALSVIGTLMQAANGRAPGLTTALLVLAIALAAGLSLAARQRLPPSGDA